VNLGLTFLFWEVYGGDEHYPFKENATLKNFKPPFSAESPASGTLAVGCVVIAESRNGDSAKNRKRLIILVKSSNNDFKFEILSDVLLFSIHF
jgi:hypothetical protein